MRNIVFVHIGLPKTATTSLQKDFFPAGSSAGILFLGVKQPRKQRQGKAYRTIMDSLECRSADGISKSQAAIQESFSSKASRVLISEEGICTDSAYVTWQEKIDRLGKIVSEFDYRILVTVREPISASYSFYCELYPKIKNEYPDVMSFIHSSNSARIYRYDELLFNLFKRFEQDRVKIVPFEWLNQEKKFIETISSEIGYKPAPGYKLPTENIRSKRASGHEVRARRVDDIVAGWQQHPMLLRMKKNRFLRDLVQPVFRSIRMINLPTKSTEIAFLTASEKRELAELMRTGNDRLREICGIDYSNL